ncbi:MAG: phosphoglycerate dehydrogenase [Planctomycetaceae bacterium]|nr:phosphoglycerate dehydrogenase [Planctomycetaceae bacterium]
MPVVFIAPPALFHQPEAEFTRLLTDAGFEVRYPDDPTFTRGRDEAETIRVLRGASAMIAGGDYLTAEVIAALPELKVIARAGVGYDRVDVAAATARGVAVTITPGANHESVAEQALGLMLAITRNIVIQDRMTRAGLWSGPINRPLREQTLGLFGLGRIGRSTAIRAKAFRMDLIAHDPFANPEFVREYGIELVDFDTLLRRSDFLSVHAPLNDETRRIFNRDCFAKMKPTCTFINTARGGLVNEPDLIDALTSGQIAAAGLEVFEQEPVDPNNPLLKLENVVLTPHRAGEETKAGVDMGVEAARCIADLSQGRWPEGSVVNHVLKDTWAWEPFSLGR